jgi:hypothetical protein
VIGSFSAEIESAFEIPPPGIARRQNGRVTSSGRRIFGKNGFGTDCQLDTALPATRSSPGD